jgi:hypothetical protein
MTTIVSLSLSLQHASLSRF